MMDEAKFAGYKDTLVHAAKQMAEEYSDAMNYASMAMDYKTICPYASSEWYTFPRPRGGDPFSGRVRADVLPFSPPTRG